jgi:AraC-like DNA-binding protein
LLAEKARHQPEGQRKEFHGSRFSSYTLRGTLSSLTVDYQEHAPGPALDPFVECLWTVTTREAADDHLVLPDGCLDIIYSTQTGLEAVGTMTTGQTFALPARTEIAGVRFRPGQAGAFLHIAARELTDRSAPLEDLWGAPARRLENRLAETQSRRERATELAQSLRIPERSLPPVQRAIAALASRDGEADLDEIARQSNLSPRQFRRRCLDESGLAPKHLCRVLRFRRVLRGLDLAARRGWAHLAAECGYYDQAHLIQDFREFSGSTPSRYAALA